MRNFITIMMVLSVFSQICVAQTEEPNEQSNSVMVEKWFKFQKNGLYFLVFNKSRSPPIKNFKKPK
jgi:thioredoxin-related protein